MNSHRTEWIGMLTAVCVLLGGLLAVTVKTQQKVEISFPGSQNASEVAQEIGTQLKKIQRLQDEVYRLRGHTNASAEWDRLTLIACMDAVTGPGISISLADSPQAANQSGNSQLESFNLNTGLIHDVDVLRVVNELFAAHAEAVSVDNQRVGPRTAIRCVGPVVMVNQVACAAPFEVEAIGDPDTLESAMTMQGGVIWELQSVGCIVKMNKHHALTLPAFDGAVDFHYARPAAVPSKNKDY